MNGGEALHNRTWAIDIGLNIDQALLQEVFELWERTDAIELEPSREDSTRWAWEENGACSARSAYAAKFWGMEVAPYADMAWKSRAPQ